MDWPYKVPFPRSRMVGWIAISAVALAILAASIDSFPGRALSIRGDFAPSDLTVSQSGRTVILNWTAPERAQDAVTGYRILRRQPSLGYEGYKTLVADTGNGSTTYTDVGIVPGVPHVYRVKALRGRTMSDRSNNADITPIAAPSQARSVTRGATATIATPRGPYVAPPGPVAGHRMFAAAGH